MTEKLTVTTSWPQLQNAKGTDSTKGFIDSKKLQASLMILKQLSSPPLNVQWTALGHFDLGQGMMWWASPCWASPRMAEHCLMRKPCCLTSWPTKPQGFMILCGVIQCHPSPSESKCWHKALKQSGLSVSSVLRRKTMWSYCIFIIGEYLLNETHFYPNQNILPVKSQVPMFCTRAAICNNLIVHKEGTYPLQQTRWSISLATSHFWGWGCHDHHTEMTSYLGSVSFQRESRD